jgi:O-methyltransferase involved in polyketide biosynthesis
LELPPELSWIEVDFPAVLDYKANLLAGEKPKCRLARSSIDVNDPIQIEKLFELAGDGPALIITEGLLMYLAAETIQELAAKAGASGVSYWISDITSPAFARMVGMDSYTSIQQMRAESHLDGLQILEVLGRHGWKTTRLCSYMTDVAEFAGERIAKAMAEAAKRPPRTEPMPPMDDPTGVHLFLHSSVN